VCGGDHDGSSSPFGEVELFSETEQAAWEHVAGSHHMASVLPFTVYGRYEDCPPDRRFDGRSGPEPWSQAVQLGSGA